MANNTGIKYGGRRTETKHNPYTHFLEAKQSLGYNSYICGMKKIITLTLIIAAFSSCSNMESDAQKVCSNFDKVKEMMPEMMKLSFASSIGTEEAKKEAKLKLDSINNELEVMGKQMEEIRSKYDEEEFKKYLLENCENAEKMMEGLKSISESIE
jgi:hypothetical protein